MELLAPAGNYERFTTAIRYGADAVYIGADAFSLRNLAANFSVEGICKAVEYAHKRSVRVYVTVNSFIRDSELAELENTIAALRDSNADALIVNDPGVIWTAKRVAKDMPLHLSTQANTLNSAAAAFWYEQGIERIVLARELSLGEVKAIRQIVPKQLELEMFVHGAMCVSYSGRCLLSNYIDGRDSNRGECVQPCRWEYELNGGVTAPVLTAQIREKGKNGEYFSIWEDGGGSFILNSRDMCLAPYIEQIRDAGIDCVKIEGRMKSILYVATVVNAYRMALDGAEIETVMKELMRLSHRPYTTGFAFHENHKGRGGAYCSAGDCNGSRGSDNVLYGGKPFELMEYETGGYIADSVICAVVLDYDSASGAALVEQRNRFFDGDTLNILAPSDVMRSFTVKGIRNEAGESMNNAPHPKERLIIGCEQPVSAGDILRRDISVAHKK